MDQHNGPFGQNHADEADHEQDQTEPQEDNKEHLQDESGLVQNEVEDAQRTEDYQLVRDREKRVTRPTQCYGYNAYTELLAYAFMTVVNVQKTEPESYSEALQEKDSVFLA